MNNSLAEVRPELVPEWSEKNLLIAITNLPPRAMMGIDSCGMLLSAIHEEEGEKHTETAVDVM